MNYGLIRQIFLARRNWFIAILVMILMDGGLYLYYSSYLEPRLASLQREWSDKRLAAAEGAPLDMAAVYRQGNADLATWRERIYPKKDFARFIGDLFETATNNSLKVGAITYKPTSFKDEGLLAFTVDFNVAGKYAAIKSFISDLERLRQIVVINNVSLSGKNTEESVGMRVQLTAYFKVEG